ncbi:MAG: TIGR01777 family oxidoreductase [Bacteroidia bacterium]|nr:TIGR01777 family oxidoreductase [Bacteroidia bacterium]MDW8347652.1 TIGR01777 family oxidoreductase [Bacteroidia bacterium]
MKIVLAGCTGFIGKPLTQHFVQKGYQVVSLVRKNNTDLPNEVKQVEWNGKDQGEWSKEIDGADAVVNLSGAGIADKKWSDERKKLIVSSRVESTQAIKMAIEKASQKPKVWVNASAVGYYGSLTNEIATESSPSGKDFLADTCRMWEEATQGAEKHTRLVIIRIGVVLEKDGGALPKMATPFKMFVGGPTGSGKQGFPWIHRDDVIGLIDFAIRNEKVQGVINATAPELLNNKQFSSILAKVLKRPNLFPAPAFMLKMIFGEMSVMLLEGQLVKPLRAQEYGYTFKYPTAESALKAIYG